MNAWLAAVAALSLLVAGCAGGGAKTDIGANNTPSAAPPTVGDETGAISGTVRNDEMVPIPGVTVAIVAPPLETQTDSAGAFTLNGVQPGTYTVVAARLGFESVARKVTVAAGEVSSVNFTLPSLSIAPEPYVLSLPHVSYIQFGNSWGHFATFAANSTGLHAIMCESCVWHFNFDPKPQVLMSEARWACSPCYPPLVNEDVWFLVNTNASAVTVLNTYLSNGEKYLFTDGQQRAMAHAQKDVAQFRINAGGGSVGGTGASGVSYNQRINFWQSFAYHQELPEGYTAFPPE